MFLDGSVTVRSNPQIGPSRKASMGIAPSAFLKGDEPGRESEH